MTSVLQVSNPAKGKMSVSAVQWLPGALSSMLPFFAVNNNTLFLRADDPNIYGIYTAGLSTSPVVEKDGIKHSANKGFNFYSAPWCISTLPSRDLGRRIEIMNVDQSVYDYITALYALIGVTSITLTDWKFEQSGFAKSYQVLQGNSYVDISNTVYFGGTTTPYEQVSGIGEITPVESPLITDDFTFNGPKILTYQLPYNRYYAVDTPIIISAVDSSHPDTPRIYFTLLNGVSVNNNPNYNG